MKVLLAGARNAENQIARAIKKYGCEVVWTSGDQGKNFPRDADALVCAIFHISHRKYYQVKDAYKEMGKPIFATTTGFSAIKEDFEKFINKNKEVPVAGFNTPRQVIVKSPDISRNHDVRMAELPKPTMTVQSAPQFPDKPVARRNLTQQEMDRVRKIIMDCHNADLSNSDTCELLAADGLRRGSGEAFTPSDVASHRHQMGISGRKKLVLPEVSVSPPITPIDKPVPKVESKPIPIVRPIPNPVPVSPVTEWNKSIGFDKPAPKPMETQVKPDTATNQLNLIGKVLNSALTQNEKLQLVSKIQSGEITSDETISTRKVRTSYGMTLEIFRTTLISGNKDIPIVTLRPDQARAIGFVLPAVEQFIRENP